MIPNYLSQLPEFLAVFAMGALLQALYWSVYTAITPQRELDLIWSGNVAAAVMMGGAMLGYAIPLLAAMASSRELMGLAQWGAVALVVQLAAYLILRVLHRDLTRAIEEGRLSVAIWAATMSVVAGLINAGAILA